MEKKVKELYKLLETCNKVAIITHFNPDGDAIGSSLALHHYFKKLGLNSSVITPNRHPSFLNWIPGINEIIIHEESSVESLKIISESDLVFTMDFNKIERCGEMSNEIKLKDKIVMIDHHQLPDDYAITNFSFPDISSTCEIVYMIIEMSNNLSLINKEIATCLYLGMMTDTGSFQYNGVNSKTYNIVAILLGKGVNQSYIYNKIYNENNISKLKILGKSLNNLNIIKENDTTYMFLKRSDLTGFNYVKGDTEGIVNYGLSLKRIEFSAMFIEDLDNKNLIKISFRSKSKFPCNKFAHENFDGGGHINAAGGRFEGKIEDAISKFKEKLKEFKS
tara:strand:+ start:3674 stop:4675 length:1002 start_codon:yes stop_codon:yes gene_type:complete